MYCRLGGWVAHFGARYGAEYINYQNGATQDAGPSLGKQ